MLHEAWHAMAFSSSMMRPGIARAAH
jgi:hypothetical protein